MSNLFTKEGRPGIRGDGGFNEIISTFKSGRTAMIFHHVSSSATMVDALGDLGFSRAVPVVQRWPLDPRSVMVDGAVQGLQGQGFRLEVDGLHQPRRAEPEVRQGHRSDDGVEVGDSESRSGGALRQGDDGLAGSNQAAAGGAGATDFVNTVWPTNMQLALAGKIPRRPR